MPDFPSNHFVPDGPAIWSRSALFADFATETFAVEVSIDYPAPLPTLLPPNAQTAEYELEQFSARLTGVADPVSVLWSAKDCPANLLAYLAWALSVDVWSAHWADDTKRAVLTGAIDVHRRKGTIGAVRRALTDAGYSPVTIIEGHNASTHDAAIAFDGSEDYGKPDHWAEYRIKLDRPITLDQADEIRVILAKVAPARSHLKRLDFAEVAHRFNAAITYDGTTTHGEI